MRGFVRWINRIAEATVVVLFATLIAVVAAAVFWRYVLNDSITWGEELARYCFIWVTFVGGGLGVGRNIHVGVDSVVMLLPAYPRRIVELLVEAAMVLFTLILIGVGIQFTLFGARSTALLLGINMIWVYAAVPVGGLVMLVNLLANFARHMRELNGADVR